MPWPKTLLIPTLPSCFTAGPPVKRDKKLTPQEDGLPPHPKVEPVDNIRPAKLYPIGTTEIKLWPKYEKVWKEIFKLR